MNFPFIYEMLLMVPGDDSDEHHLVVQPSPALTGNRMRLTHVARDYINIAVVCVPTVNTIPIYKGLRQMDATKY